MTGAINRLRKWAILPIVALLAASGCSKGPSSNPSSTASQPSSANASSPVPSAPSEPGPEGTGSEGGSADASASSSSSSADGSESPASGSDASTGNDDKSRDDLMNEQIAPWSRFEQIAPNRLKFYFASGTERCYGTRVAVKETETSVEVATVIGRLPNAPRECTLELRKASVTVKTDKPIGERKVRHLEGIQLH